MEALVQRLAPPPAHVDPDEYSVGGDGEGNLNALGVVRGMQVPRVPDVSAICLLFAVFLLMPNPFHVPYAARSFPLYIHKLNVAKPSGKDQARTRNDHPRFPIPWWNHRQCRF